MEKLEEKVILKQPELIFPKDLISKINEKLKMLDVKELKDKVEYVIFDGIKPWEYDFTALLGKVFNIAYSIYFTYSKVANVFKVSEFLYVSPTYQPYYQITIKQKEELESSIKAQLASIVSLINDYLLAKHDLRKYENFYRILKEIKRLEEEIKREKDEKKKEEIRKKLKEQDNILRGIFIDQVDVHTGDFSLINLARTRWTTLIADFLELENEINKDDVLKKLPNISTAEAILLAKKNALYLEWKKDFERAVYERYENVKGIIAMREASIKSYKQMLRPYIEKWLTYQEIVPKKTSFFKPASQMEAMEYTRYWIFKPVPHYMYLRPRFKYPIDYKIAGITETEEKIIRKKERTEEEEKIFKILNLSAKDLEKINVPLPIEPSLDRVVRVGIQVINENFKTNFTLKDIVNIRNEILSSEKVGEKTGEIYRLSPYYVFIDIEIYRTVLRLPDGTTAENFSGIITPYLISQNLAILMLLQVKAIEKWVENQINLFLGEYKIEEEIPDIAIHENSKKLYSKILDEFYENFVKKTFFTEKIIYENEKGWDLIADRYYSDYLASFFTDIKNFIKKSFSYPI